MIEAQISRKNDQNQQSLSRWKKLGSFWNAPAGVWSRMEDRNKPPGGIKQYKYMKLVCKFFDEAGKFKRFDIIKNLISFCYSGITCSGTSPCCFVDIPQYHSIFTAALPADTALFRSSSRAEPSFFCTALPSWSYLYFEFLNFIKQYLNIQVTLYLCRLFKHLRVNWTIDSICSNISLTPEPPF